MFFVSKVCGDDCYIVDTTDNVTVKVTKEECISIKEKNNLDIGGVSYNEIKKEYNFVAVDCVDNKLTPKIEWLECDVKDGLLVGGYSSRSFNSYSLKRNRFGRAMVFFPVDIKGKTVYERHEVALYGKRPDFLSEVDSVILTNDYTLDTSQPIRRELNLLVDADLSSDMNFSVTMDDNIFTRYDLSYSSSRDIGYATKRFLDNNDLIDRVSDNYDYDKFNEGYQINCDRSLCMNCTYADYKAMTDRSGSQYYYLVDKDLLVGKDATTTFAIHSQSYCLLSPKVRVKLDLYHKIDPRLRDRFMTLREILMQDADFVATTYFSVGFDAVRGAGYTIVDYECTDTDIELTYFDGVEYKVKTKGLYEFAQIVSSSNRQVHDFFEDADKYVFRTLNGYVQVSKASYNYVYKKGMTGTNLTASVIVKLMGVEQEVDDSGVLHKLKGNKDGVATIPDTVNTIGERSIVCDNLSCLQVPASVEHIADYPWFDACLNRYGVSYISIDKVELATTSEEVLSAFICGEKCKFSPAKIKFTTEKALSTGLGVMMPYWNVYLTTMAKEKDIDMQDTFLVGDTMFQLLQSNATTYGNSNKIIDLSACIIDDLDTQLNDTIIVEAVNYFCKKKLSNLKAFSKPPVILNKSRIPYYWRSLDSMYGVGEEDKILSEFYDTFDYTLIRYREANFISDSPFYGTTWQRLHRSFVQLCLFWRTVAPYCKSEKVFKKIDDTLLKIHRVFGEAIIFMFTLTQNVSTYNSKDFVAQASKCAEETEKKGTFKIV